MVREHAAKALSVSVSDTGVVKATTHASRVESALEARDVAAALQLLVARPGELLRRLDHLLRLAAGDDTATRAVLDAVPAAAAKVSPAVLLSALGALRVRDVPAPRRVFFPKGGSAKVHIVPEDRTVLDPQVVQVAVAALTGAALERASALPPVSKVVVDEQLRQVMAPFANRTASRALVTLPRGSALALPAGRTMRLFVHWMQAQERVDLDLSVAFFTGDWDHVGTCDYTNLTYTGSGGRGAVHSGDLTDAPAPHGASEFVDLDVARLLACGVRYVVPAVFSYNNVAFVDMAQAFAGFMAVGDPGAGEVFRAGEVEQRFDLTGRGRACVPMVLDLEAATMRWVDLAKGVTGTNHAVHRYVNDLGELGQGVSDLFGAGSRVSLGEVGLWHAAGRARSVVLRRGDGSCALFTRGSDESVAMFAARLVDGRDEVADQVGDGALASGADLAFLHRGDVAVAENAAVYALHPDRLDPAAVRLLEAAHVANALTPVS